MEESWVVLVMLFSLCCVGYAHEDIGAQVELLKKALDQQRTDLQIFQSSMNTKMEALRADVLKKIVPSSINDQLEESLQNLSERSVDCISHVASKIRHLERGYQQMKRQVNILSRHLKPGEMPLGTPTPGVKHEHHHLSQRMNHLQRDVNDTRRHVTAVDKEVTILKRKVSLINETCQAMVVQKQELDEAVKGIQISMNQTRRHVQSLESQYDVLKDNLNRIEKNHTMDLESIRDAVLNVTHRRHARPIKASFTSPPMTTPPSRIQDERTRVLVVRFWYKQRRKPHQIDMRSNGMKTYRHLRTAYVGAITYDASSRRLIFSRNRPAGVYSCRLDVTGVTALRVGVRSWGITVDVARQLIFLTTFKYTGGGTVARMSGKGGNYSDIVDFSKANSPVGIAIDGRKRLIYFCTSKDGLWSVDYDGKTLHRLHTGGMLRSVTMDIMNNNLYFSDRRKVMMLSLTSNVTSEVAKIGQDILKLVYYNNSLYISSFKGSIDVLHLSNNEYCNLKMMDYMKNTICLIP